MLARIWIGASLLLLLVLVAIAFEVPHSRIPPLPTPKTVSPFETLKPGYVVLPPSEAATYVDVYFSNTISVKGWQPTETDIAGLEANLPQISNLKEAIDSNRRIDHPDQYFRQYLAIVQSGRKQIFVSGFCLIDKDRLDALRSHLAVIVDGGPCYWQAYYDPLTQRFSNLMINGRA